jgi:hypothetical protein
MKRGLWILAFALFAGVAGFCVTHWQSHLITASHDGQTQLPELEWLRREFHLTDDQFAKVAELHHAYRPTCEALCARVIASHQKMNSAVEAGSRVSPELKAALEEHAALHVECQTAMLTHLYQTAACMSPEQARRYLDVMLPQCIAMPMEPASSMGGH